MSSRTQAADLRSATYDGRPPHALAAGWGVPAVECWARIGSTNDRAAELARSGAPRGTVVLADAQGAGRGRRGARWHSPAEAGVWMSVVLGPDDASDALPLLVGVACAEAIEETCEGAIAVGVKWPNDLLVGERKVGGILVEVSQRRAVVGVGLNVKSPSDGLAEEIVSTATTLEVETGITLSRSRLAGSCVVRLMTWLGRDAPVTDAIAALAGRDVLLDRAVVTEQEGSGVARGIAPDGSLLLERPDGTRVSVRSGSVRLGTV